MKHTCLVLLALAACKSSDPPGTPDGPPRPDATIADAGPDAPDVDANPGCQPLATDYTPRDNGSADDAWPECISDDNTYHRFEESISTIARIAAFEEIAARLFTGAAPSAQDFIDAEVSYLQDQGLESRTARREDEHYPPVLVDGNPVACQSLTPEEQQANPERCVGPAQIHPLLDAAFTLGQDGASTDLDRRLAAARIEAGLLWFLYVSVHKEAITCTTTPRDCDSSYAYYSGGEGREAGLGLSRYVRSRDLPTHHRIWDGVLAVRCWRDLDNPEGTAEDLEMRDRAVGQLDAAALRGVAMIVRDWAGDLADLTGDDATVAWERLQILGRVLDRDARLRDTALAAQLRGELAVDDAEAVDPAVIIDAIDGLYPCP
jgi:hypothetical protein